MSHVSDLPCAPNRFKANLQDDSPADVDAADSGGSADSADDLPAVPPLVAEQPAAVAVPPPAHVADEVEVRVGAH